MMRTRTGVGALAMVIAGTLGCDKGSGDGGATDHDGGGGGCEETVTVLGSSSEMTDLGFTADDVLATAAGDYQVPFVWSDGRGDELATVEFGPESGEATLDLSVAYEGGEVRYVHSVEEESEWDGPASSCLDRVEVDVKVTAVTSGGALNETFTTALSASRAGMASIDHTLPFDGLQGNLEITKLEPAEAKVMDPELRATFTGLGVSGSLDSGIELEMMGWVGFGPFSFGVFPGGEQSCEYGGIPAPVDGALQGFSAADVMAVLHSIEGTTITWGGGAPSDLTFTFGDPTTACFSVDEWDYGFGTLIFDVTAQTVAADGSIDGTIPLQVTAYPNENGELDSVSLGLYAYLANTFTPDAFVDAYGITGFDLTPYDEAALEFSGWIDTPSLMPKISGELAVHGVKLHDCSDEPGVGCPGNDYTELGRASWGN